MFKRLICAITAVLTFGIGVGLWLLEPKLRHSPPPDVTLQVQPVSIAPKAEIKRTYHYRMRASGRAGRFDACFGGFSSSDGMNFSSTNIYFDYPKEAQRELQRRLKKALKIVSREPAIDDMGRVVGEQVVATFAPYQKEKESTASAELILVKGSDFVSIASASLRNITQYKHDLKP